MRPRIKPRGPRAKRDTRRTFRELTRLDWALDQATGLGTMSRTDAERIRAVYADFNIVETDYTIEVANTAAARTGRMPKAERCVGRRFLIKDTSGNAGTNNITLMPVGSQTIDGAASAVIDANYGKLILRSNGHGYLSE